MDPAPSPAPQPAPEQGGDNPAAPPHSAPNTAPTKSTEPGESDKQSPDPASRSSDSPSKNEKDAAGGIENKPEKPSNGIDNSETNPEAAKDADDGDENPSVAGGNRTDNIYANTANIFNNIKQEFHNSSTTPASEVDQTFFNLPREVIQKITAVFVPPENYDFDQQVRPRLGQERIYVVAGDSNSGRFPCAIHTANRIRDLDGLEDADYVTVLSGREKIRPSELFLSSPPKEKTFYILRASSLDKSGIKELGPVEMGHMRDLLKKAQSFLFLCAPSDLQHCDIDCLSIKPPDIRKVLSGHLDYYGKGKGPRVVRSAIIEKAELLAEKLETQFEWPRQVDFFCNRLARLSADAGEEEILELAKNITRSHRESAAMWFTQLAPNDRLYAMLVVLFERLQMHELDGLYVRLVAKLHGKGFESLRDPMEASASSVCERLGLKVDPEGRRRVFDNNAYQNEVEEQLKDYHDSLVFLGDELATMLLESDQQDSNSFRNSLAKVIGRLGSSRRPWLIEQVTRLASHSDGFLPKLAPVVLASFAGTGPKAFMAAIRQLRSWTDSGIGEAKQLAIDSLSQVYSAFHLRGTHAQSNTLDDPLSEFHKLVSEMFNRLDHFSHDYKNARYERLVNDFSANLHIPLRQSQLHQQVVRRLNADLDEMTLAAVRSFIFSLCHIAHTDPEQFVGLITDWWRKEPYDAQAREISLVVVSYLFRSEDQKHAPVPIKRQLEWLTLLSCGLASYLEAEGDDEESALLVTAILNGSLVWIRSELGRSWVEQKLLEIVHALSGDELRAFLDFFSETWMATNQTPALEFGADLCAHIFLLLGGPCRSPDTPPTILVTDGLEDTKVNRGYSRQVASWLPLNTPTTLLIPGRLEGTSSSQNWIDERDSSPDERPRIIVPPLERIVTRQDPTRILIDCQSTPIDQNDLTPLPSPWELITLHNGEEPAADDEDEESAENEEKEAPIRRWLERVQSMPTCAEHTVVSTSEASAQTPDLLTDRDTEGWLQHFELAREIRTANTDLKRILQSFNTLPPKQVLTYATQLESLQGEGAAAQKTATYAIYRGILRHLVNAPPPPAGESAEPMLKLLRALPHLSMEDYQLTFQWIGHWNRQSDWQARFVNKETGGSNALFEFAREIPTSTARRVQEHLAEWMHPDTSECSADQVELYNELNKRLNRHASDSLPELLDSKAYGIICIDSIPAPNSEASDHTGQIAPDLVSLLNENHETDLATIVYQIGHSSPLAVRAEKIPIREDNETDSKNLPGLIGPILENFCDKPVAFIVIISDDNFIDQQDWGDNSVAKRVFLFRPNSQRPTPFQTIRRPSQVEGSGQWIYRFLEKKLPELWP